MSPLHWKNHVDHLRLTVCQRRIMDYLDRSRDSLVSSCLLADHLYGFDDDGLPKDPENTIRAHIYYLRKRLEGSPLDIETSHYGRSGRSGGYRLISREPIRLSEDDYLKGLKVSIETLPPRLDTSGNEG